MCVSERNVLYSVAYLFTPSPSVLAGTKPRSLFIVFMQWFGQVVSTADNIDSIRQSVCELNTAGASSEQETATQYSLSPVSRINVGIRYQTSDVSSQQQFKETV